MSAVFLSRSNRRLYYRIDGPDDAPVLVLAHSLGLDHGMWDPQVPEFAARFRVVRFDMRGHGASDTAGPASIGDLAGDVLALMDALGVGRFAFCGLSIGGMIGQWLAAHHPSRLSHLVLANTTPRVADPAAMGARGALVLEQGMAAVVDTALSRFFSAPLLDTNAREVAWARRTLLATDPAGYAECCFAIRDMDQRADLKAIVTPTLVIGGDLDASMPWPDHGAVIADTIPGARALQLPAAHISNLEMPRAFLIGVMDFLAPRPVDLLEGGTAVRRAVLGAAHVDRSNTQATDMNRDFVEYLTRSVWGSVWTRHGVDHRTRRLLVIAMTAALGRWEEFRLHVKAGLAHRLETCDVREVLLQVAAYAGVPAANTGFHVLAEEVAKAASERSDAKSTAVQSTP